MRLRILYAVAMLCVASAVVAQPTSISVFATGVSRTSSQYFDSHWTGGGGVAMNHFWTTRVSTELTAAAERDYAQAVFFDRSKNVTGKSESAFTRYPFDLIAQYHFTHDSRWTPYAGAGVRYTDAPRGQADRGLIAEVDGGVMFAMTPRFGLVLDGRMGFYSHGIDTRPRLGLSWRF